MVQMDKHRTRAVIVSLLGQGSTEGYSSSQSSSIFLWAASPYPSYGHIQLLAAPRESSSGSSQSRGYGQSRSGGNMDNNLPMVDSNKTVNGSKAPLTSVGVVDSRTKNSSYSGRK
ncbi:hypothetical protein LTLLF_157190 [Microtus ochrogaster]|uniref:Uncharacterized protein n=1 Tax=Microtus ochrogaster TaxID=79684 RepID=A0A8J6GF11_MICOH|nr:hypothetical protein LTLLF_157190 [Microtus ochrogaster]